MKKQYLFSIITGLLLFAACSTSEKNEQIVQQKDIEPYLNEQAFEEATALPSVQGDLEFWKSKLDEEPGNMVHESKLAAAYSNRFGITKNIEDLQRADSLYKLVYNQSALGTEGYQQALAQLSVTKHDFESAEKYSYAALETGGDTRANNLLIFDALMERGDYVLAEKRIDRLGDDFSFGYLIRRSKYKDYEGQLDSAIYYMEKAATRIGKRSSLHAWSKSNLGDMYGHANRIEDSYQAYLEVLQKENSGGAYLHSLEGIAWIAYAHDNNTELAKEILQFVDGQIQSPDVKLTLAEIAEFEGNTSKKEKYLQTFVEEARKPAYGGMYNAYLIDIAATQMDSTQWAMELVEKELENRPTPQIYDLKAWTYLHQDQPQKALEIIREHVEGKTYEPVPAYHMARIYQANGMEEKAKKYYKEALTAGYELGPVTEREIKKNMKS